MPKWDRLQKWITLTANVAILLGIVLLLFELSQNTKHLRLQLVDQINSRQYQNNRDVMGENPMEAISKSVTEPENMSFSDFRIVDAYLINGVSSWEDTYFLYEVGLARTDEWRGRIDDDVAWYFGNRFAKKWWRTTGVGIVEPEFGEYISLAIESVSDDATYGFFEKSRVQEVHGR